MATTPKTPQELYDEITSAFAQAELVGNELQSQLQRKVAECNALAASGQGGSGFMALEYKGESDAAGHWKFGVKGRLQSAEMEVNPKPGRIAFAMKDEKGQPKGPTQLLKIEQPAADLPEYLAASVIQSVIEATEFNA
jgi:hypothetical protein